MKQVEFQTNANSTGVQQFRRLKHGVNPQGKNVYLYQRTYADGEHLGQIFGFEVFVPSITKAGTVQKFPNGTTRTIDEDMENYPGASVFGRSAFFCQSLERADGRFATMMGQEIEEAEPVAAAEKYSIAVIESTPVAPKHRGRPKVDRPTLLFPVGEFSVKELAEQNKVDYPVAFLFLKEKEAAGLVEFTREERRAAKGKATKLFRSKE